MVPNAVSVVGSFLLLAACGGGAPLVAGDVGNTIWRVSSATEPSPKRSGD